MSISFQRARNLLQSKFVRPGPLMASGPYKQAVLRPRVPVWRAKVAPEVRISHGEAIRKKLEAIYKSSATDKLICMRCGGLGHKARECKNGLICFACNRLGHRATHCKTATTLPPRSSPVKSDLHASNPATVHLPPAAPSSSSPILSPKSDLKASVKMAQYKTPIFTLPLFLLLLRLLLKKNLSKASFLTT